MLGHRREVAFNLQPRLIAFCKTKSSLTFNTTPNMPSEAPSAQDRQASAAQARQVIDVFHEISTLLVRPFPYPPSLSPV